MSKASYYVIDESNMFTKYMQLEECYFSIINKVLSQ